MTPEFGAATQLEKIDMLDFADIVASTNLINAARWMPCAMCGNNINATISYLTAKDDDLPVYGTMASQFNDPGMNTLFAAADAKPLRQKQGLTVETVKHLRDT